MQTLLSACGHHWSALCLEADAYLNMTYVYTVNANPT